MPSPVIILSEFSLAIDLEDFLNVFWIDSQWYHKFLVDKLCDINVEIGSWSTESSTSSTSNFVSNCETQILRREVHSYHPSKITFPGLPSHAESIKTHTIERYSGPNENKTLIKESNNFRGIPYSDYFSVNIEWIVTSPNKTVESQGTIESNTRAEMLSIYEMWLDSANDYIRRSMDRKQAPAAVPSFCHSLGSIHSNHHSNLSSAQSLLPLAINDEQGPEHVGNSNNGLPFSAPPSVSSRAPSSPSSLTGLVDKKNIVSETLDLLRNNCGDGYESSVYPSDDEFMFYDCEEGENIQVKFSQFARSIYGDHASADLTPWVTDSNSNFNKKSPISNQHGSGAFIAGQFNKGQVDASLLDLHGVNHPSYTGGGTNVLYGQSSSRDIAVNIVETFFVLAQYSFWQVYQIYMYDLKELFNVESSQVASRIINSFLPGWHSPILLRPDVYGPLLAVFMLPQSLLLSMEISKVGCNPTSQLGNAVVVSLCLWIGLSTIYRLLAYVIAPPINMKHCLSMTGYSFFSWNLALLCSYPLELYKDEVDIPLSLPLMVFCIPSSLALGCMFWEHTAASSLTLKPESLPTYMGGSTVCVQQFASQNSRCLQRILWAFPKILVFLIVTGTHYQFLWYMAKVFLPGRRQLCRLSALIQPSRYADILTQKEFRHFAVALLSGKKD